MRLKRFNSTGQRGKHAEVQAQQYLLTQGMILVEQNFRCVLGEIDIIMRDQAELVFIEVRSRSSATFGNALESISQKKIERIVKTAQFYLQKKSLSNSVQARFDVISLQGTAKDWEIEWIRNAFTV